MILSDLKISLEILKTVRHIPHETPEKKSSKNVLVSLVSVDTSDSLCMNTYTQLHMFHKTDTPQAKQHVLAAFLYMLVAADTVAFCSHPAF